MNKTREPNCISTTRREFLRKASIAGGGVALSGSMLVGVKSQASAATLALPAPLPPTERVVCRQRIIFDLISSFSLEESLHSRSVLARSIGCTNSQPMTLQGIQGGPFNTFRIYGEPGHLFFLGHGIDMISGQYEHCYRFILDSLGWHLFFTPDGRLTEAHDAGGELLIPRVDLRRVPIGDNPRVGSISMRCACD